MDGNTVDESNPGQQLTNQEALLALTVYQVGITNDDIWLHLARAISREIRKRAKM
jgi:hypothetical protein